MSDKKKPIAAEYTAEVRQVKSMVENIEKKVSARER